jgi:hypothetical protein
MKYQKPSPSNTKSAEKFTTRGERTISEPEAVTRARSARCRKLL